MSTTSPEKNVRGPRTKKRKFKSTSPRQYTCTNSECECVLDCLHDKTGSTSGDSPFTINSIDTQVSQEYVSMVMNPQNQKPIMNFSEQNPFSTLPNNGVIPKEQTTQKEQTTPPPWAAGLIADIHAIKISVSKIDKIEQTVNKINMKIVEMERKVESLETKVIDCEKSCQFISEECENQKDELKYAKSEIKGLQKSCNDMRESIKQYEKQKESMNDKLSDLESRSMRDNLIFYGILEQEIENCETLVKTLIREKLELDTESITLDRVHRMGAKIRGNKPRPIVAKFHRYSDRERVRLKPIDRRCKERLVEAGQGVGIQWPQQWREARRALFPIAKEEERAGNRTRINGNKLYINGTLSKKFVDGKVCDATRD